MEPTPAEHAAAHAAATRDSSLSAAQKKRGGIVHTPPELARFVARAADDLLRDELGLAMGLCDPQLAVIDPACGPGAFLAAAAAVAAGRVATTAPVLLHGFDRDRAAIDAARATLGAELSHDGFTCELTCRDTLHDVRPERVARLAPVICVLGNPPWVASAQAPASAWLAALLDDFRRDAHGAPLGERKLGVLSDAYVRFMRWACEVARHAQRGAVVALVTNASYLDGPVHRGMRALLLREFDTVHVIDLGGSALVARAGGRDDNVFGVRPAVAVALLVRRPDAVARNAGAARVRYARVTGSRADKLQRLGRAALSDLAFSELAPAAPYLRLVPTHAAPDAYARWPSLAEALPFHREGVQTNRDAVVVDVDRARLIARVRAFADGSNAADLGAALHALPHYDPERARAALRRALFAVDGDAAALVRRIAYRPFDTRWFIALTPLCHRPRPELLRAVDAGDLVLISARKDRGDVPWTHFAAARDVPDNCFLSARSSCRTRAFPSRDAAGNDNLSRAVADEFGTRVGRAIDAGAFVRYALAVLASPHYRQRHDQALHIDYPRIPPPRDAAQFERWCGFGDQLAALFSEPLSAEQIADDELAGGVLVVDRERGEVRRGARVVGCVSAAARDLCIGHHRPFGDLARTAELGRWSDAAVVALCVRVERLCAVIDSLPDEG